MGTNRLEAFSDGVLAIIITIMVLEMKIPDGASLETLRSVLPVFLTYVGSFIYVGIYWNNHHHMMHSATKVSGSILWSNLFLLFWLSLFPFVTGWMGENHFEKIPVALYGSVLMMAAIAFKVLENAILKSEGRDSVLYKAYKNKTRENLSILAYFMGIVFAFFYPIISIAIYIAIAAMWLIPDRRVEKSLTDGLK